MPSKGLVAARAYAKSAAAVPHAHHMPSHIFVRLGLWDEAASSNENAWRISEEDVKNRATAAHSMEDHGKDFHALNYLQYAYIQMGRYRDAKRLTDMFKAEYDGLADKKTAPDTPLLQAKHVKGRTIFGLPDRMVYGYFDTLARYLIETQDFQSFSTIPLVAPSRDFVAMKTQLDAAAAYRRGDAAAARAAADKLVGLSNEPGQHPFVKLIITIQAKEAEACRSARGERWRHRHSKNERGHRHRKLDLCALATTVSGDPRARNPWGRADGDESAHGRHEGVRGSPEAYPRTAQSHLWDRSGGAGHGRQCDGQTTLSGISDTLEERGF